MPVKYFSSNGYYDDVAIVECQHCKEVINQYQTWDGSAVDNYMQNQLDCELYTHERYCLKNTESERSCKSCDHLYEWAGDEPDCMKRDKHFLDNGKQCNQWEHRR